MLVGGCRQFFNNIVSLNMACTDESIWEKEFSNGEIKDVKGLFLLFAKAKKFFYEKTGGFKVGGFLYLPTLQEKKCEKLKEIVKQNLDLYTKTSNENPDHTINDEDHKEINCNETIKFNEVLNRAENSLNTNNKNFEDSIIESINNITASINNDHKEDTLIKDINDIFIRIFKPDNDAVLNIDPFLIEPDLTFIKTDKKITNIELNEENKKRLKSLNSQLKNPVSKFSFSSLDLEILKLCLQINENDLLLNDNNQSEISIIK